MSHRTQHLTRLIVSILLGLFCTVGISLGAVEAQDDLIVLPVSTQARVIPFETLLKNDRVRFVPSVALDQGPSHGTLSVANNLFIYQPDETFWDLGSDQFTYIVSGGLTDSVATVVLIPARPPLIHSDGFELSETDAFFRFQDGTAVVAESEIARISGNEGLMTSTYILGGAGDAYIYYPVWAGGLGTHDGGDNGDTGATTIDIGMSNFSSLNPGEEESVVLVSGCDNGMGWPRYRLRAWRLTSIMTDSVKLVAEVLDDSGSQWSYETTETMTVEADAAYAELTYWWRDDNTAGVRLRLDGRMSGSAGSHLSMGVCEEIRLGVMPVTPSAITGPISIYFDNFQLSFEANGPLQRPVPQYWLDGFESGGFDRWSSVEGLADFTFVHHEVSSGFASLQVPASAAQPHWLVGTTPDLASRTWNARFTLDGDDLNLPEGALLKILDAGSSPQPVGESSVDLFLAPSLGNGLTLSTVWTNEGQESRVVDTLSAGPHTIEVQYRAASSANSDDGFHRVWVDGELKMEAVALVNFDEHIQWLRLGAETSDPGVSGSLRVDGFLTW